MTFQFRHYWNRYKSHLGLILATGAVAGGLAIAISFTMPKTYQAETSLLPRKTGMGSLSTLMSLGGGDLPGLPLPVGDALSQKGSKDIKEILESRTLTERVIARLKLESEFSGWTTREQLIKRVRKANRIIPPTVKNNVLIIRSEARSATVAQSMANVYVEELKKLMDELGYTDASHHRQFVERQLEKSKTELATAEKQLAEFQSNNRLVSLPETVSAAIRSLSELEAKQMEASAVLSATRESLNALKDKVETLQANPNSLLELEIKERALLAQQSDIKRAQNQYLKEMSTLPPRGLQLARLQRDVQVRNAVYLMLTQQFQAALLEEARDSDAFIVLDKAVVPEKPLKPNIPLNFIGATFVGMALGTIFAFMRLGSQKA